MKFHVIDKENWDRQHYFEHFLRLGCTFSITNNLNITALLKRVKQKKIKLYPVLIYMISSVINANKEFRTCLNDDGFLGYWEQMIPSYTIFHNETKLFSSIWTEFSDEFGVFYNNYLDDLKQYGDKKNDFLAKENEPPNTFPVSCVPWISFTGFNLNIKNNDHFLFPIVTVGKFFHEGNKTLLPISLQVHHAVCDGYHASKFLLEVQQLADQCQEWLFV
jgi:chloramphenicol O-acetyltransferase type A